MAEKYPATEDIVALLTYSKRNFLQRYHRKLIRDLVIDRDRLHVEMSAFREEPRQDG